MNAHLTETQLFALLDSKTQPGSNLKSIDAAHLAGCATCRAEFDVLRDSIANFRITATNLSALYTPTRLLEPPVTARPRFFTVPRAAWAGGLVAAMALCTASIGVLYRPPIPTKTRENSRIVLPRSVYPSHHIRLRPPAWR